MLLHFGKCKCLHTGHGNLDEMGDTVLGTTVKETDLGVTISAIRVIRWRVDEAFESGVLVFPSCHEMAMNPGTTTASLMLFA